jgi:signal transduction histidine kinase
MTIRTRLTLWFTVLVSALLLAFCVVIYYLSERYRRAEYEERLRQEALTSVELLFGKETISPETFKLLDKNRMTVLNQEEIIIYNYLNRIIYESGTDYLTVTPETMNRVRLEKEIYWREGNREIVGTVFQDRYNRFVVFASAVDKYGFLKQRDLALILTLGWLLTTVVILLAGWLYAGRSLRPLQRVVGRVDEITASQLSLRLAEGTEQDEISQLSQRFNQMLDRLEDAFRSQRAFVAHASHELRTPLTAITGQLQVSLMADESPADLRATMQSVLDDVRGMNQLANGLLSLANISLDENSVRVGTVAVDELLLDVEAELLRARPSYRVRRDWPDQPDGFSVPGTAPLLRAAFLNLMENGCKFSPDHTVTVRLQPAPDALTITFQNGGMSIPADELPTIFQPFRRGTNARSVPGHGIGLSLTERIVRLHQGRIGVVSDAENGTLFSLTLPISN